MSAGVYTSTGLVELAPPGQATDSGCPPFRDQAGDSNPIGLCSRHNRSTRQSELAGETHCAAAGLGWPVHDRRGSGPVPSDAQAASENGTRKRYESREERGVAGGQKQRKPSGVRALRLTVACHNLKVWPCGLGSCKPARSRRSNTSHRPRFEKSSVNYVRQNKLISQRSGWVFCSHGRRSRLLWIAPPAREASGRRACNPLRGIGVSPGGFAGASLLTSARAG